MREGKEKRGRYGRDGGWEGWEKVFLMGKWNRRMNLERVNKGM
jgi:hypothetical protein